MNLTSLLLLLLLMISDDNVDDVADAGNR